MVQITSHLLDPKGGRTALASIPIVSSLLPVVDEAHKLLLDTQRSNDVSPRLAAIQGEQAGIDTKHDRKMRGGVNLLDALADLADDPEDARRYRALSVTLCPEGVKGITKSYTDEAGAAKLLEGRLDAETKKQLAKIPIPGGKLLDAVNDWSALAAQLGELEKEKIAITGPNNEGVRLPSEQRRREDVSGSFDIFRSAASPASVKALVSVLVPG